MFCPFISLSFTQSDSKMLYSAFTAPLYMVWLLVAPQRLAYTLRPTFISVTAAALVIYYAVHAAYIAFRAPVASIMEIQWAVYFVAAFMIAANCCNSGPKGKVALVRTLIGFMLLEGLLGVVTCFTGPIYPRPATFWDARFHLGIPRGLGTFESGHMYGGIVAAVGSLAIFADASELIVKRWLVVTILTVGVFVSQSKSGILSYVLAVEAVLLVRAFSQSRMSQRLMHVFFLFALAGLCAASFDTVWGIVESDLADRLPVTMAVWSKFVASDVADKIVGIGFRGSAWIVPGSGAWATAHNSYVSLLAETGVLGLTAMLVVWCGSFVVLFSKKEWGLAAALLAISLHCLSETFIYAPIYVIVFGAIVGMAHSGTGRRASRILARAQLVQLHRGCDVPRSLEAPTA
jgi:hypothetical protein